MRILTGHEHLEPGADGERVRDLRDSAVYDVVVRRRVVDARYLEASIPATHTPSFELAPRRTGRARERPAGRRRLDGLLSTVLGSGKTAVDACVWLLDNDVDPARHPVGPPSRRVVLRPPRPFQPLDQVGQIMEGIALDAEAAAHATDLADLFERLEASERMHRIDPSSPARMFRGTMLSARELAGLRQIEDVVRLGRVRRIEPDRIVLDQGEVATKADVLHVDCTARGLRDAPATPIFGPGRITLQQVRQLSPCFNAALAGFLEVGRDDDAERNRLCPPNPYPSAIEDWPRMVRLTWKTEQAWLGEPDVSRWIAESRLNLLRALPDHMHEPLVQTALQRYLTHVDAAIERLDALDGQVRPESGLATA